MKKSQIFLMLLALLVIFCIMIVPVNAEGQRDHPDPKAEDSDLPCLHDDFQFPPRYHPDPQAEDSDPFIYHVDIGNVTFDISIERMYLTPIPILPYDVYDVSNLYVWFTPEIKERQDNRELNTVFKFEGDTKDLVVFHPEILEDDILYQNNMMLNYSSEGSYWKQQWLDKNHDTNGHRHTLDIGQKHTIVISCWHWFCPRPDGSTFEEHSWDIPRK